MFSRMDCPKCQNDMVGQRSVAQDAMDLPQGVPAAKVKHYPADCYMFACISCGREEVFVRGPNGGVQYSRVWPKGRWCEIETP